MTRRTHLLRDHQRRLLQKLDRLGSVVLNWALDRLDRELDDGEDGQALLVSVERDRHRRLDRCWDVELEEMRSLLEPPVPSSELPEDLDRRMRVMVVERDGLEEVVESGHEVAKDGSQCGVEKLGGEVVYAKLERSETLADELGTCA